MKFILKADEVETKPPGGLKQFPTYVSPILNLANYFSHATRPEVVGQMTELFKQCPYSDYEGWKRWYLEKHPGAIDDAAEKMMGKLNRFKSVMELIDEDMVRDWVERLVLAQTFVGLRIQKAIMIKLATHTKRKYRFAKPEEESKGIDGFIGDTPVSIKPETYKVEEKRLGEEIGAVIIYYRETPDGIEFEFDPASLSG